jgi:hypothetical protein
VRRQNSSKDITERLADRVKGLTARFCRLLLTVVLNSPWSGSLWLGIWLGIATWPVVRICEELSTTGNA